jgi:hypothetical protein
VTTDKGTGVALTLIVDAKSVETIRRRSIGMFLVRETSEALTSAARFISSLPSDLQPVFDTVAASAPRLWNSSDAEIFRR